MGAAGTDAGGQRQGLSMSMMRCNGCDNYIDTDEDVEGVWEDGAPHRYWCGTCVEGAVEAKADNCPILAAYKKQDPQAYADAMDETPPPVRRRAVDGCDFCKDCQHEGMMPYHDASPNCESGKRIHCTCDTCF